MDKDVAALARELRDWRKVGADELPSVLDNFAERLEPPVEAAADALGAPEGRATAAASLQDFGVVDEASQEEIRNPLSVTEGGDISKGTFEAEGGHGTAGKDELVPVDPDGVIMDTKSKMDWSPFGIGLVITVMVISVGRLFRLCVGPGDIF
jgi:hypothetical protein